MPTLSPLARGFGAWTGELLLDDSKKNSVPSLPSLLSDAKHCHGVTIRAKSAVSGFRSVGHGDGPQTDPHPPGAIPKTYLTRKGAIVLFSAPDDPGEVQLSARDRAYLRKAKRKLLKHRYVDYSSKIGSLQRLTQSVLSFGDQASGQDGGLTEPEAKAYLKFLRSQEDANSMRDRKSTPGYNFDMYFDGFMSRCGSALSRPATAHANLGTGRESQVAVESPSLGDAASSGRQATPPSYAEGRWSPKRRLNTEQLAASLKSGGYLGRQTIAEGQQLVEDQGSRSASRKSSKRSLRSPAGSQPRRSPHSPQEGALLSAAGFQDDAVPLETDRQMVQADEYMMAEYDDLDAWEEYEEEEEDGGPDGQFVTSFVQPVVPMYQDEKGREASPGLLSLGSGGTFSFAASQVDDQQGIIEDSVSMPQGSMPLSASSEAWTEAAVEREEAEEGEESKDSTSAGRPLSKMSRTRSQESLKSSKSHRSQRSLKSPAAGSLSNKSASSVVDDGKQLESALPEVDQEGESHEGRPGSPASSHSGVHSDGEEGEGEAEEGVGEAVEEREEGEGHQMDTEAITQPEELSVEDVGGEEADTETAEERLQEELANEGVTDVSITPKTHSAASRPDAVVPPTEPATVKMPQPATDAPPASSKTAASTKPAAAAAEKNQVALSPKPSSKQAKPAAKTSPKQTTPAKPTPPVKAKEEEPKKKEASAKPVEKKVTPAPQKPPEPKVKEAKKEKKEKKAELKEANKPEAPPATAQKTFAKVFDIKSYDKKDEKPEEKAPAIVKKPPEPEPAPKAAPIEIKPESLLSDTKAEIQRLFGNLPTASDKKPAKKESAPKRKRVVIKAPPPVPLKTKEEKELDKLEKEAKKESAPKRKRVVIKAPPPVPLKTKEEKELDKLEKEEKEVLGGNLTASLGDIVDEEGEGLTAEEMALEQELLQEKLLAAENRIKGEAGPSSAKGAGKSPRTPRDGKKKGGKEDKKEDIEKRREALKEAKRLEKQKRLEEAKKIEEELREKEKQKKAEYEEKSQSKQLLETDIAALRAQAEEAEAAEEEARAALLEMRRQAREEREARRREEQERRKQEAQQRKEEEKKRREAARARELEMLSKLASREEQLRLAEEERRRREDEEEHMLIEEEKIEFKLMEQERLERKRIEGEEARIAEIEKEVEEQALSQLTSQRDEALYKKRQIEEQARALAEEEERLRQQWEADQQRIEEERRRQAEEEEKRREAERVRIQELQRLEQEARERMRLELQRRREALIRRRDLNIERRQHLEGLKTRQGMTKPWFFTYYVGWPRYTYEKRMGGDDSKNKGRRKKSGK